MYILPTILQQCFIPPSRKRPAKCKTKNFLETFMKTGLQCRVTNVAEMRWSYTAVQALLSRDTVFSHSIPTAYMCHLLKSRAITFYSLDSVVLIHCAHRLSAFRAVCCVQFIFIFKFHVIIVYYMSLFRIHFIPQTNQKPP